MVNWWWTNMEEIIWFTASVRLHSSLKHSPVPVVVSCTICHFTCICKCMDCPPQPADCHKANTSATAQQHPSSAGAMTNTRSSGPLDVCPSVYLQLFRYNRDFCFQVSMFFLLYYIDAEESCFHILNGLSRILSGPHVAYNVFWPSLWLLDPFYKDKQVKELAAQ